MASEEELFVKVSSETPLSGVTFSEMIRDQTCYAICHCQFTNAHYAKRQSLSVEARQGFNQLNGETYTQAVTL